jgi:hypothetical protein
MNVAEGARRIRLAGQWLVMIPLTLALLAFAIGLGMALMRQQYDWAMHGGILLWIISVYLTIPGGALWLASWILDGFAKDPE